MKEQPKLALSLRGGGVNCVGYIGVFKAFEEENIRIDAILASSAAAVIGCAYAMGMSFEKIIEICKKYTPSKFIGFDSIHDRAIASDDMTIKFFKEYIGDRNIEDARIPLYIQATNTRTLNSEIFTNGPAAEIITASMALPLIFHPVKIGEDYYFDGDMSSAYGVKFLKSTGIEKVIGLNQAKFPTLDFVKQNDTFFDKFTLPLFIALQQVKKLDQKIAPCDFIIDELGGNLNMLFDADKAYTLVYKAYERTMKFMPMIKDVIYREEESSLGKVFGKLREFIER